MRRQKEPVSTEIEAGRRYTPGELDAIASQILRDDSKSELCRKCEGRGEETGGIERVVQPAQDEQGHALVVDFAELVCSEGHIWYAGEGKRRGIGGEDPILFEEHIQSRKRREIMCRDGTPDPNIVQGQYNRSHPSGRKVNSEEQRKKGSSYYR